jgi:D-psicose/D-tagatose/L-ribulose 3-epimerase
MKLALCNEVLRELPFAEQCRLAAALGFDGLELAPFTLADDPSALTALDARRLRDEAAGHGLAISSLHWLMVAPAGMSIATADAARHARSVDFLRRLIDFAAACGAEIMVHGSPQQRSPVPGQTVADALARATAAWAQLAPHAAAAGVTYCIEPLSAAETPVINRLAEAFDLIDAIGSPALRSMLDVSAASTMEDESPAALLARHWSSGAIAHVQVNDRNRRGPGQGETPIAPVIRVLQEHAYRGWVAVEPFDYRPDPLSCAAFCGGYMRALLNPGGGHNP